MKIPRFQSFKTFQKGFTLVEILIVVSIIVVLGVAAADQSIKTQRQFSFLNQVKQIAAEMRQARIHAVTHLNVKDADGILYIPPSYGVQVEEDKITTFANVIGSPDQHEYDPCPSLTPSPCDYLISAYPRSTTLDTTRYQIQDESGSPLGDPYTLVFEPTYAVFSAFQNGAPVTEDRIVFKIADIKYDFYRYIIVFTKSGLIEVSDDPDFGLPSGPTPST